MNSSAFRIRRATVDDLTTLRALWQDMRITTPDLDKRLTEFQIAEDSTGKLLGAVGFQIVQRHGLIHSEAFSDFGVADQVRPLFWTRLQALALNHGVARLWTRENTPFWPHCGLHVAEREALNRMPEGWDRSLEGWLSLRLKDEDVMASLDKEFDLFVASEKARSAEALGQARTLKLVVTVIGMLLALAMGGAAVYVMLQQRAALPH